MGYPLSCSKHWPVTPVTRVTPWLKNYPLTQEKVAGVLVTRVTGNGNSVVGHWVSTIRNSVFQTRQLRVA
jgi:hypothetical protein